MKKLKSLLGHILLNIVVSLCVGLFLFKLAGQYQNLNLGNIFPPPPVHWEPPPPTKIDFTDLKQSIVSYPNVVDNASYRVTSVIPSDSSPAQSTLASDKLTVFSDKYFILLYSTNENGNVTEPIPETANVKNLLGKTITRVKAKTSLVYDTDEGFFGSKLFYYYSDDFRTNSQCGDSSFEGKYCGSSSITVKDQTSAGIDLHLKVICNVDTEVDVKYCDEFINNLQVQNNTQ